MKIILFSPSQSVSAAKELLSSGVPCNRFLTSNSNSAYYLEEKLTGAPWKYGDKRNLKNMDETFQKRNNLRVKKEEWKRNCCTTQEFEKDIQTILTDDEIISNHSKWNRPYSTFLSKQCRSTKKTKKNWIKFSYRISHICEFLLINYCKILFFFSVCVCMCVLYRIKHPWSSAWNFEHHYFNYSH